MDYFFVNCCNNLGNTIEAKVPRSGNKGDTRGAHTPERQESNARRKESFLRSPDSMGAQPQSMPKKRSEDRTRNPREKASKCKLTQIKQGKRARMTEQQLQETRTWTYIKNRLDNLSKLHWGFLALCFFLLFSEYIYIYI